MADTKRRPMNDPPFLDEALECALEWIFGELHIKKIDACSIAKAMADVAIHEVGATRANMASCMKDAYERVREDADMRIAKRVRKHASSGLDSDPVFADIALGDDWLERSLSIGDPKLLDRFLALLMLEGELTPTEFSGDREDDEYEPV